MSFHIFSELLMALICVVSGILLVLGHRLGRSLSIAGLSMILYSVLNAAGYFGERGEWMLTAMFIGLFVITSTALFLQVNMKP
jgi:hypothetical protein